MKTKKIVKIIAAFIPSMMLICFLLAFIFYLVDEVHYGHPSNSIWYYLLYLFGYGSLERHSIIMQNIMAIISIVMLSIFSAYLTVNLFWRGGDVFISNDLMTWKKEQNQFYASILIGNSGKSIYRLSLSMVLYDENGKLAARSMNDYTCPLLVKKGIWAVNIPIIKGRSFLFDAFSRIKVHQKKDRLFVILEYVDGTTCQENVIVKEIYARNIRVSGVENGFNLQAAPATSIKRCKKLKDKSGNLWRQLKKTDISVLLGDSMLIDWLKDNIIPIRLSLAHVINAEVVTLSHKHLALSGRDSLIMDIDFSKRNERGEPIPFAMACLTQYPPQSNWKEYYRKDAAILIYVSGTPSIEYMYLEIKDQLKGELLKCPIPVTEEITEHRIRLQESDKPVDLFENVMEVCITVFAINTNDNVGVLYVDGCELMIPQENM